MRQLLVLIAVAGLATGAAEAAFGVVPVKLRTPGAELLDLQNGRGRAVVTRRGSLLVQIVRGKLRVVDVAGGSPPNVSDACRRRARRVSATTIELRGRRIGCRIWSGKNGGPWQVVMKGRGISASGIVRGSLTLDARDRGPLGLYRIGARDWQRWPRNARTIALNRK
jgi:hypothetical protein